MKRLWLDMGFSKTPKAHLIFCHAVDEQDMFDGLGDKIEDPIENIEGNYLFYVTLRL